MAKTHSHKKLRQHERAMDTAILLGMAVLTLEVAGFLWVGAGFTASMYTPPKQTETRFDRQIDSTGISAPKFTACERRALKIRNEKRREQLLTICHSRSLRGAASSSSSSSSSISRRFSLPKESQEFLDMYSDTIDSLQSIGGTSTISDDALSSPE